MPRSRALARLCKTLGLIPRTKRGERKDPVFTNAMVILERPKRKFRLHKKNTVFWGNSFVTWEQALYEDRVYFLVMSIKLSMGLFNTLLQTSKHWLAISFPLLTVQTH